MVRQKKKREKVLLLADFCPVCEEKGIKVLEVILREFLLIGQVTWITALRRIPTGSRNG